MKIRNPLILASLLIVASVVILPVSKGTPAKGTASSSGEGEPAMPTPASADGSRHVLGTGVAPGDEGIRLVDHAGDSAVFRVGDALRQVRIGERVPDSNAVLRHVRGDGVRVEFAADAAAPALLQTVRPGEVVGRPAADRIVPPIQPHLEISSIHMARPPEAAQARTRSSRATEN